jgi:hypothetical protein
VNERSFQRRQIVRAIATNQVHKPLKVARTMFDNERGRTREGTQPIRTCLEIDVASICCNTTNIVL